MIRKLNPKSIQSSQILFKSFKRSFAITARRPKRVAKWQHLSDKCLVFVDLEMTGLDVEKDVILEVYYCFLLLFFKKHI